MGFSITAERTLNKADIGTLALERVRAKNLISSEQYVITQYMVNDDLTFTVKAEDKTTGDTVTFQYVLKTDLCICPDSFYSYYIYRFTPRTSVTALKRGDAIRTVKAKTSDTDTTWFAYNGVVIEANAKLISYVMVPSEGPMIRQITSRQAYTNGVVFYKYKNPDTLGNVDNHEDIDDAPIQ